MAALWPNYPSYGYYIIDSIEVSKDPMTLQTGYILRFSTIDNPNNISSYSMMFADEHLSQLNNEDVIRILAYRGAKEAKYPVEFEAAVQHWWTHKGNPPAGWKNIGYMKEAYALKVDYKEPLENIYNKGGLLGELAPMPPAYSLNPKSSKPSGVDALPGIGETVDHPMMPEGDRLEACSMYFPARLRDVIIHLNDAHKWTREQIADWLETLDVDLRFKSEDDRLKDEKERLLTESYNQLAATQKSKSKHKELLDALDKKILEVEKKIKQLEDEINE